MDDRRRTTRTEASAGGGNMSSQPNEYDEIIVELPIALAESITVLAAKQNISPERWLKLALEHSHSQKEQHP